MDLGFRFRVLPVALTRPHLGGGVDTGLAKSEVLKASARRMPPSMARSLCCRQLRVVSRTIRWLRSTTPSRARPPGPAGTREKTVA